MLEGRKWVQVDGRTMQHSSVQLDVKLLHREQISCGWLILELDLGVVSYRQIIPIHL